MLHTPPSKITCKTHFKASRFLRSVRNPKVSMEFSGFPRIANLEYSPLEAMLSYPDEIDKAYPSDASHTTPDNIMNTYFDSDSLFDQPLTSAETSSSYPTKQQDGFNPTLPANGIAASNSNVGSRPIFNAQPFGQFEQYPFGFSFDPNSMESRDSAYFSPNTHTTSRTPSLCGDAPQEAYSPTIPPRMPKQESPASPESVCEEEEATPKRPLRKRGRPRLEHSSTDSKSTTPSSAKSHRSGRLPHNQVERKYREGLNSELERLRKAVPSLPQSDEGGVMGQPKPSKAMVLSSAIEYIRKIEKERDELKEENEQLRQRQGGNGQQESWRRQRQGPVPDWTRSDSLDEFLTDP